ncbi:MAG: Fe(3+) ABC transporter substrate-binding protein [Halioglobus sp.]
MFSLLHSVTRSTMAVSLFAILTLGFSPLAATAEVNLYSARQEALIKPLLDKFTEETGITVNLVTGKGDSLLARLKNEGRNSPADMLLTTDAGRLYRAQEAGVLQATSSEYLETHIPLHLRSAESYWYGLSVRARFIVYAKDRVKPTELSSYQALAGDEWRNRICVRSSSNIYNQSLVASMIAHNGVTATDAWLKGFVSNFARPPQGGDRDQIKAVAAGQCDIAVVNSYYLGAMINSDDASQRAAAEKVAVFWPDQAARGTHINISGAGITSAAKNTRQAKQLLEFLANDDSQRWYAQTNREYPVRSELGASPLLESWGEYKADSLDVSELGKLNAQAVMAMDRARWK